MDFKCYQNECIAPPLLFCSCSKELIMLCPSHIQDHILSDETKDHTCKTIYKKVDEIKRKAIMVKTQEILTKIKYLKARFNSEHIKAIENLEKIKSLFLNNFKKAKDTYKKILSDTLNLDKILGFPGNKNNKYIDADIENISKLIEEAHLILPAQKIIEPEIAFFDNYCKNLFITEIEADQSSNYLEIIYFFKGDSKTLVELQVESLEMVENELNVNENLGLLASMCLIPGGNLFYNGGYSGEGDLIASTYIINLKTKHAEILPKARLRCTASALYYSGSIYIFGGCGKSAYKNSDRFNLKRKC